MGFLPPDNLEISNRLMFFSFKACLFFTSERISRDRGIHFRGLVFYLGLAFSFVVIQVCSLAVGLL